MSWPWCIGEFAALCSCTAVVSLIGQQHTWLLLLANCSALPCRCGCNPCPTQWVTRCPLPDVYLLAHIFPAPFGSPCSATSEQITWCPKHSSHSWLFLSLRWHLVFRHPAQLYIAGKHFPAVTAARCCDGHAASTVGRAQTSAGQRVTERPWPRAFSDLQGRLLNCNSLIAGSK